MPKWEYRTVSFQKMRVQFAKDPGTWEIYDSASPDPQCFNLRELQERGVKLHQVVVSYLDQVGQEGWEMVGFVPDLTSEYRLERFAFKRPKSPRTKAGSS